MHPCLQHDTAKGSVIAGAEVSLTAGPSPPKTTRCDLPAPRHKGVNMWQAAYGRRGKARTRGEQRNMYIQKNRSERLAGGRKRDRKGVEEQMSEYGCMQAESGME